MILFRDVICLVVDNEQGCSLITAKLINHAGIIPQAMGRRRGGNQSTHTTTNVANAAPWAAQQPYLTDIFTRAKGISETPQTYYPGQTYAPFSPQTEQALNLTEARALGGSPLNRASSGQMLATLRGDYLPTEQGFETDFGNAYEASRNKILPDIQSRYAEGGRYGSGLARQAEAKALADSFASQKLDYRKAYQDQLARERSNQLTAMQFSPQLAETDYADISRLAGAGSAREAQSQTAIDEAVARHQFAQMEPSERLARYMQMIHGNYGGSQTETQTQPVNRNRGAGILGGALGGAGAGGVAGPWGALGGALLGGILGGR